MNADNPAPENQENEQNNQDQAAPPPPPPPQPPRTLEFDMFMMYEFRTKDCPPHLMQDDPHPPSRCTHVHPGTTRRRDPRLIKYSPEFCEGIPDDCEDEDNCEFSHNIFEHCLHPRKFKKTRCFEGLNCSYFPCLFPHNPVELNMVMLRPPLHRPPRPPPSPVLPLPANMRMPPPGAVVAPRPFRPLPLLERPPPSRFRNRLPPLPERKDDDEASSSGTKRKFDEIG